MKRLLIIPLLALTLIGCEKMTPEEKAAYDAKYAVQREIEAKNQEAQDNYRKEMKDKKGELHVAKRSFYGRHYDYTKDIELKNKEIVRIEIENKSWSTKTSHHVNKSAEIKIYYKDKVD